MAKPKSYLVWNEKEKESQWMSPMSVSKINRTPWTDEELDLLTDLHKRKVDIEDMMLNLPNRSKKAIQNRLLRILPQKTKAQVAVDMINAGQPLSRIRQYSSLSKDDLRSVAKKHGVARRLEKLERGTRQKSPYYVYPTSWGYVPEHARDIAAHYGGQRYGGPTREQAREIILDGRKRISGATRPHGLGGSSLSGDDYSTGNW